MKQLTLVTLMLLLGGTLMAQAPAADESAAPAKQKHFAVGLHGGIDRNYHIIDMSYMQDLKYDEFCQGTAFGLDLAYMPWPWLAIRTGAVLLDKDYNMTHIFQYEGSSTRVVMSTFTQNKYIDIPLVADLSFGKRVRVHGFGGGYYGYWLSSHRSGVSSPLGVGSGDFDEDVEFSEVRDNRKEYGFVYGAGLTCTVVGFIELFADVRWYYSVTDIQNDYQLYLNPRYNTTMVMQGGVRYLF